MPLLRSARMQRCLRSVPSARNPTSKRHFAAGASLSAGHDSGPHYDPPSGWLWGVPPGEKRAKEGWEGIYLWGMWGSLGLGALGYAFKSDTTIQTWALEEARRRLEVEGILEDPTKK